MSITTEEELVGMVGKDFEYSDDTVCLEQWHNRE